MPSGEEDGTRLICRMALVSLKATSSGGVGGGWLGLFFAIFLH